MTATTTTATAAALRTFTIDKAHSEVHFQVRHLVTRVRGRFTDFSGTPTIYSGQGFATNAVLHDAALALFRR